MEQVMKRSKQLILNPFHGYAEEDRNILNPFMDETIKELALIDGDLSSKVTGLLSLPVALFRQKPMKLNFRWTGISDTCSGSSGHSSHGLTCF